MKTKTTQNPTSFAITCPNGSTVSDTILLSHGGGGRMMHALFDEHILPRFNNAALGARHDGAFLESASTKLAMTTDSYVVNPLFFPGGDIGKLSIYGTVNDLAMCGAKPIALSAALILEEGFPIETFDRVLDSMRDTANECGVEIVTGDTKVVDRGKGDKLFVTTTGIGQVVTPREISPILIRSGDAILVSGDLGRHGIAILAAREGLAFETTLESDCASLLQPVMSLIEEGIAIHCLRDLTRGGFVSAAIELAQASRTQFILDETAFIIDDQVRGACELLGLDPLYVANEGRFLIVLPVEEHERALSVLRRNPVCTHAQRIGVVETETGRPGNVILKTRLGTRRALQMFSGEQLPRIC